jgi:cation diffusion facilitator CzcD-associated flavoprotein CzcO
MDMDKPRAGWGNDPTEVDIAIIGAGLGGLCAAAQLREAGLGRIVVFEKSDGVGGVWNTNRYPNIACDTPIDLYAISYYPGSNWSQNFAPGREIREYLQEFADTYGVTTLIEMQTEIAESVWDEAEALWHITARDGRRWVSRFLVWAGGLFSRPAIPKLPGLESFEGRMLHSTSWSDDVVLDGKRVAVVGAGATAIQIMPYAAQHAQHVVNFVRTPSYVMPRPDMVFSEEERGTQAYVEGFRQRRAQWFQQFETIAKARFPMNNELIAQTEDRWRAFLESIVQDPRARDILTPRYRFGCKRPLFSNDYYPAMTQPNVELVGKGVARIEPNAVVDTDGVTYKVDMIVWATGFDTAHMLDGLQIVGPNGRSLTDAWRALPEAYYGTMVKGFPNLFLMNGPNIAGASISEFLEGQLDLIIRALKTGREEGADIIDVPEEVHDDFNAAIQTRADVSVMVLGNCESYYRAGGTGRVFTHWPGTIESFCIAVRKDAFGGLRFSKIAAPA